MKSTFPEDSPYVRENGQEVTAARGGRRGGRWRRRKIGSMVLEFSGEQSDAIDAIKDFLGNPRTNKAWFSLHGLAGTGKTTVLAAVAREQRGSTICSYTGKAASILTRKTGLHATTVHSAIMRFLGKTVDERGDEELMFTRHVKDGRWQGRTILLDEDSMIPEDLAHDLIATGAKIVTTGDPGQLRPVRGKQFFEHADFMLTEIRRQALESPIIRQAHSVRAGGTYSADSDAFRVQRLVGHDDIVACDIILCWRNATRRALNTLKRAHLSIDGPPRPGEPVMCLKNDHELGILNGAVYDLLWMGHEYGDLCVSVRNERGEDVVVRRAWFEDVDEANRRFDDSIGFAWAYSSTCHKYQGSESNFIILVDEYDRAEDRARWLYTGITRASQKILIQRNW